MEEDAPVKTRKPILLIALGGNALIRNGQKGTIAEQFANLREPARQIAKLSESYRIIITHGNGPQVGNLLLQQECCSAVPQLPLEMLVAQTEGQIGYMIESTLDEALMERGIDYRPLVTLITYVVVDQDDPSFKNPTKPIGPAYLEAQAATLPYPTVKTHKGYRRVVVSPKPVTIVEKKEIGHLIDSDFIVVCCGGGGIPVVRQGRAFAGVNAVIDKDLASALLACEVGADFLVITTDVPGAMLHYGTAREELIGSMSVSEALQYLDAGHFASGSMQPKVEAAVQFVQHTKKRAAITALENIEAAVEAGAATQVVLERQ